MPIHTKTRNTGKGTIKRPKSHYHGVGYLLTFPVTAFLSLPSTHIEKYSASFRPQTLSRHIRIMQHLPLRMRPIDMPPQRLGAPKPLRLPRTRAQHAPVPPPSSSSFPLPIVAAVRLAQEPPRHAKPLLQQQHHGCSSFFPHGASVPAVPAQPAVAAGRDGTGRVYL